MKKSLKILLITQILSFSCFAQINGITEFGDDIILYDNGQWEYKNDNRESNFTPTNSRNFYKNKKSSFLLKSKKTNIGIWIDSSNWEIENEVMNPDSEYEFAYKNSDVWAMAIVEEIEIPIDKLGEIAHETLSQAAPNARIVEKEYRTVNGLKVLYMRMNGTMDGVDFSYKGYYYSNNSGTIQLVVYSSQRLINKNETQCEEFLNGITTF